MQSFENCLLITVYASAMPPTDERSWKRRCFVLRLFKPHEVRAATASFLRHVSRLEDEGAARVLAAAFQLVERSPRLRNVATALRAARANCSRSDLLPAPKRAGQFFTGACSMPRTAAALANNGRANQDADHFRGQRYNDSAPRIS